MGSLDLDDVVFAVVDGEGGQVAGRTRLQKVAYFVTYLLRREMAVDPGFVAHHYGPYSSHLSAATEGVVGRGLLHEVAELFATRGFAGHDTDQRRYSYTLTPRGEKARDWRRGQAGAAYDDAVRIARHIVETGADYRVLSYAAKAHYVLRQESKPVTRVAMLDRAKTLGWEMSGAQLEQGVELLEELDLLTPQE